MHHISPIEIYCRNTGSYISVEGGSTLSEIFSAERINTGSEPICALVNNKAEHLGYRVFGPKEVEYLGRSSSVGREVYTRSLCMMLYRAVCDVAPELTLRCEHAISRGIFCRLYDADGNPASCPDTLIASLLAAMCRLHEADHPFERHEKLTADVIEIFRRQRLDDKVRLLESVSDIYTSFYTLDGTADSFYGPLAPSTGALGVFDLRPWHDGMLLLGPDTAEPSLPAKALTQDKMFRAFEEHLQFNRVIRVASVGQLNDAVAAGDVAELINVAEAMHAKLLGRIADVILERRSRGEASIILIAGPSSSGKTTTSKRLAIQLMTNLIKPKLISLDDYFVDREKTPRDADGEYDYESIHALDLDLFNADLRALLRGETINLPTYSFELGRRIRRERPLSLGPDEVLIVEGIHGLNPELTPGVPREQIFKMYVSALTTLRIDNHNWISTSDTRLLRRMVRDYKYRGTSPADTIRRWPSVRRGEEKWIFPFQENADATFNSSLLFEIAVMKEFVEPLLEMVPHNVAEYTTAYRLLRFLHYFRHIPHSHVPSTSLLREFLGGSSFRY
ncbi:MAG: nucleoside kinase [Muribaculaceae bacterium]|nr:nucleoside kinase [Muribaculaceae bacterium]